MIRKTNKSCLNPYGFDLTHEALRRPCIFGIFPENSHKRSLNGYLNKIMYLMQIRHFGETNSDYDITNIPFDIIAYEKSDNTSIQRLLESIPENDVITTKKIIRNVNIVSYCNGHDTTYKIINEIYEGLLAKKYSIDEAMFLINKPY